MTGVRETRANVNFMGGPQRMAGAHRSANPRARRWRRITLVGDEIASVINQPLIEILNKGAEGGIHSICAMRVGDN